MKPIKKKKCKGIGIAKGNGCGELTYKRTYGLCQKCNRIWATETDVGMIWLKKQTAYKMKRNEKEEKKQNRSEHNKMKIDVMSADKYRSIYVQPLINKIADLLIMEILVLLLATLKVKWQVGIIHPLGQTGQYV